MYAAYSGKSESPIRALCQGTIEGTFENVCMPHILESQRAQSEPCVKAL